MVLGCAAIAALAVYAAWLDAEVRQRFEGSRWSLPAKVYASPLELYPGRETGPRELVRALERQGYRRAERIDSSGRFRIAGNLIDLHSRPFTFWDGEQPARKLRLRFDGGRIGAIEPLDDRPAPVLLRLDPLLIGSIYPAKHGEDRILAQLGEVPPMLAAGLIVVEDRDFLDHHGVSPKAILRAAWVNLRAGGIVQGGSTITQQLVKNFYLNNRRSFVRKAKEALMAVLLDAHYPKEEILEAYINEVYLGQDGGRAVHGFGLASYFYFGKPLGELQTHEVALLVGMVKGPGYYHPQRHPERALARRNLVLSIFEGAGFLAPDEAARARRRPLGVTADGKREHVQYPAFIDLVRRQLHGQYRDEDLTSDGLRIFTTLDPSIQSAVEARVAGGVADLERGRGVPPDKLETAAVVTSVEGGRVLALVGGRDPRYAGFNRALDARRPIGSLVKPVVYLTALGHPARYNLLTPLDDGPVSVTLPNGDIWEPDNYDRRSHGSDVPLYRALSHSYNLATARLALELGLPSVVSTLKALGYPGEPPPLPSLALGAVEMTPLEVAQIYNTLAAGGYHTPLMAIREVTTKEGEPLNRYPLRISKAVDEQSVYLLNWILQRVMRHGTGRSAYYTLPDGLRVAGKTGTTGELRDSWFAGFAANRVGVVWLGRDDNRPSRFTGASGALQLWSRMMGDIGSRSLAPLVPEGIETLRLVLDDAEVEPSAIEVLFGARDCAAAVVVPFMSGYPPRAPAPCEPPRPDRDRDALPVNDKDDSNWLMDLLP